MSGRLCQQAADCVHIYLHVSGHFTRNASAIVIGNGWPLPFLDPYSNTEQHKNSVFFVRTITNWNHLSDDQRRPPHLRTSDDGSPPKAPSNSHAYAPLPSHLYLKLGPVTYHIKIKFDKLKKYSHLSCTCTLIIIIIIIDRFYIALFSALEQTHCARMWFYMSE